MKQLEITDSVIGFIGLGLIGGSIAKRLKKVRPDLTVMAYMRTPVSYTHLTLPTT